MLDILRDSTLGQLLNAASGGKLCSYPEQRPDYIVPSRFLASAPNTSPGNDEDPYPRTSSGACTLVNQPGVITLAKGAEGDVEKGAPEAIAEKSAPYPYLVDWEENDPDNPR